VAHCNSAVYTSHFIKQHGCAAASSVAAVKFIAGGLVTDEALAMDCSYTGSFIAESGYGDSYTMAPEGNCVGRADITTKSDCEQSATILELEDKTATAITVATKPQGCIYTAGAAAGAKLEFNSDATLTASTMTTTRAICRSQVTCSSAAMCDVGDTARLINAGIDGAPTDADGGYTTMSRELFTEFCADVYASDAAKATYTITTEANCGSYAYITSAETCAAGAGALTRTVEVVVTPINDVAKPAGCYYEESAATGKKLVFNADTTLKTDTSTTMQSICSKPPTCLSHPNCKHTPTDSMCSPVFTPSADEDNTAAITGITISALATFVVIAGSV
jgi:hypothetical protein